MLNAWIMSVAVFILLVVWFGVGVLPWLVGQAVIGFCILETVDYTRALRAPTAEAARRTIRAGTCLAQLEQQHGDRERLPVPSPTAFRSSCSSAARVSGALPCRRSTSTPGWVRHHAAVGVVTATVAACYGPARTRPLSRRHPVGGGEPAPREAAGEAVFARCARRSGYRSLASGHGLIPRSASRSGVGSASRVEAAAGRGKQELA